MVNEFCSKNKASEIYDNTIEKLKTKLSDLYESAMSKISEASNNGEFNTEIVSEPSLYKTEPYYLYGSNDERVKDIGAVNVTKAMKAILESEGFKVEIDSDIRFRYIVRWG